MPPLCQLHPSTQTCTLRTDFPLRQTRLCQCITGQMGQTRVGGEDSRVGGAHGQHPGAIPGCTFTSDPKPRGLQMSTRVSVLGRFVCGAQEKWSKDPLSWLRFECTVISYPGEGIPYLVTHFRKSSLLACDNNQGRERKFPGVCTLSPRTA